MKTIVAIIIVIVIGILFCIRSCKRSTKDLYAGIISGYVIGFGFLVAIVNAASPTIYSINGLNKNEVIQEKYFLFHIAHVTPSESKFIFLAPYGKNRIQNNTNTDLSYWPIYYGDYHRYNPVLLPAHTIYAVYGEPSYFFESVPSRIWVKMNGRGKTKWVILLKDEEVTYLD